MKKLLTTAAILASISAGSIHAKAQVELNFIDLSHPIPTFAPSTEDATKPDLSQPIANSTPIAGFYHQAVLYPVDKWATNQGHFESAAILIQEHNGTSFNAPNHYKNNAQSAEKSAIPFAERKAAHQLTTAQLTGDVVLIDVSQRVEKELAKNGGLPSPDTNVTA